MKVFVFFCVTAVVFGVDASPSPGWFNSGPTTPSPPCSRSILDWLRKFHFRTISWQNYTNGFFLISVFRNPCDKNAETETASTTVPTPAPFVRTQCQKLSDKYQPHTDPGFNGYPCYRITKEAEVTVVSTVQLTSLLSRFQELLISSNQRQPKARINYFCE